MLGVTFDSKLNWSEHIANAINKAKKSLFALRLLRKYFNYSDMRALLDTYFYSTLYYNSVIWLTPVINSAMEQKLLSVSAMALRSCLLYNNTVVSFENVHKNHAKSTPAQLMLYQSALNLFRIFNFETITFEIVTVLNKMTSTPRQINFQILRDNNKRIGMNTTANKLYCVSGMVGLMALNLGFVHFKKLMKYQFLKYGKT